VGLRRLRARLDQVQGEANHTMGLAQDLIADLQDGFGVRVSLDADAVSKLFKAFTSQSGCDLPFTIKVDPTIDTKE
jgi:hypothetical protein